jgi:hypothetical protein
VIRINVVYYFCKILLDACYLTIVLIFGTIMSV